MLGLIRSERGNIYIDGESISGSSAAAVAGKAAYIPQSSPMTFNYSVFDMILMGTTAGMSFFRTPGKKERQIAQNAMEKLGIADLKDRGFSNISGGERQLALIARALCQQAKVLIMDEPTANLDYGNTMRVLQQIKDLSGSGYTILHATHQPNHVLMYADEVMVMKEGVLTAKGVPGQIITKDLIKELYGVDVSIESLCDDRIRVCVPQLSS
jgi:iron complex transport system ATP-binding protein